MLYPVRCLIVSEILILQLQCTTFECFILYDLSEVGQWTHHQLKSSFSQSYAEPHMNQQRAPEVIKSIKSAVCLVVILNSVNVQFSMRCCVFATLISVYGFIVPVFFSSFVLFCLFDCFLSFTVHFVFYFVSFCHCFVSIFFVFLYLLLCFEKWKMLSW